MSDIAIRVFRDSDRASVIRGLVDLQNFEVPLHDTRLPGDDTAELYFDRMRRELAEGQGEIFIAEQQGAFVGFVGCLVVQDDVVQETPDSNRHGYIKDIFVDAGHRGHGIVQLLLSAAERHLAKTGVSRLRLNVLAGNLTARRADERYGFLPYEVTYEKRVGGSVPVE